MLPHRPQRSLFRRSMMTAALCATLLASCTAIAAGGEDPAKRVLTNIAALLEADRIAEALALAREEIVALHRGPDGGPRKAAARAADLGVEFFMAPSQSAAAWGAAEVLLRDAAQRWEAIGPAAGSEQAETLSNLSSVLFYQDRWDEAAAPEERALSLRSETFGAESPQAASSLQGLGFINTRRARFEQAEAQLTRALAIREKSFASATSGAASEEDRARAGVQLIETLGALGDLLRLEDRLEEAEASCRRAVEVSRAAGIGETMDAAAALNNLAGVLKDQSRYDEAAPLLAESLRLRREQGAGSADVATALLNLAELRRLQGREEDAGSLYDDAIAAARESMGTDNPELFWFLNQRGAHLRQIGRLERAEPYVSEALALLERTLDQADPMNAVALQEMAELRCDGGRFDEAGSLYERARAIRAAAWGETHPDTASTLAARAACLGRSASASPSLVLEQARAALAPLRATSLYPEQEAGMLSLEAVQLWKLGQRDAAIASQREAVDTLESLRPRAGGSEWTRAGFFRRHADEFDRLAIWLLDQGKPADALVAAERGRARSLLDQLAAAHVDVRSEMPQAQREQLELRQRQAAVQLAESQERLRMVRADESANPDDRRRETGRLEQEVSRAAGAYREAYEAMRNASLVWRRIQGIEPATLAQAQQSLAPRRGLILFYLVTQERSVVLAVPPAPAPPFWGDVPGGVALAESVPELVRELSAPPPLPGLSEEADDTLGQLEAKLAAAFTTLLPPAMWDRVRRTSEVILIPDGPLHAIPFEALVVRPAEGRRPARYWLDDGPTIRYAASLSLLEHLAVPRAEVIPMDSRPGPFLLTVGDPAPGTDSAGKTPLPGSAMESAQVAASVRERIPSAAISSLSGSDATEPRVRAEMPGARFIHMATHAQVDRRGSDLFAALQLAPAPTGATLPENDGSLHLFEIYDLRLRSDLAVLSACATQYGRQMEGEGAMALARGFLAAGSRRVVASLWPVEDLSTARLISTMFAQVARAVARGHEIQYARALAAARREVRNDPRWSAPFYWAPFILTGAP